MKIEHLPVTVIILVMMKPLQNIILLMAIKTILSQNIESGCPCIKHVTPICDPVYISELITILELNSAKCEQIVRDTAQGTNENPTNNGAKIIPNHFMSIVTFSFIFNLR